MSENIEFTYEVSGNTSYMSVVLEESAANYQLEMLTNNDIKNILQARKIRKNNQIKLSYDITSKVSLEYMLGRGKISRSGFFNILNGMIDAYEDIQEYQLVDTGIVLDKKYIYVNPASYEPMFVYLPIYEKDSGIENMKDFFNGLILEGGIEVSEDNCIQIFLETINSKEANLYKLKEFVKRYRDRGTANGAPKAKVIPDTAARPQTVVQSSPQPSPQPIPQTDIPTNNASVAQNAGVSGMGGKSQASPIKREIPEPKNKKVQTNTKTEKKSNNILKFALLQIGVLLIIVGLITQNVLRDANGKLILEYLAGAVIIIAALDLLAFKKLVMDGKSKQTEKPQAKPQNVPSGAKNIKIPSAPNAVQKPAFEQPEEKVSVVNNPPVQPVNNSSYAVAQQMPERRESVTSRVSAYDMADYDDEKTEIIGETECPYLIYFDEGLPVKINLDRERIVVGRQHGSVDVVINNSKMSKIHAEFAIRNSSCFVMDCNSKNGVYINDGPRINANTEYELKSGDKVRLANVEMVLNMI